jgi:hypothetical protein
MGSSQRGQLSWAQSMVHDALPASSRYSMLVYLLLEEEGEEEERNLQMNEPN